MSEEIVFYHNPMSRARMVHWMLEETGAPYRIELLSFDKGENKKPAFLAVSPMANYRPSCTEARLLPNAEPLSGLRRSARAASCI